MLCRGSLKGSLREPRGTQHALPSCPSGVRDERQVHFTSRRATMMIPRGFEPFKVFRLCRGIPVRFVSSIAVLLYFGPLLAHAAPPQRALAPESINSAEWSGGPPPKDRITPLGIRVQVLLDRARFSPGEIDGKFGENARKALRAFAEAQQLPFAGELTQEIWQKLVADDRPVLTQHTIAPKDVAGPFLGKLPSRMEDLNHLPRLNYTSPRQELAENFHMSEELLSTLNPDQHFDRAGVAINVAAIAVPDTKSQAVEKVEIDKQSQTVEAFDKAGKLISFYPATVGSEEKPSPSGALKVTSVHFNPTYGYNPEYRFKGVRSKKPFTIEPGPNNPVGTVWINLSAEGYGIHGTAYPGKVSKAQSHGCVRLTNWDAEHLARQVKKGTSVIFD
jgi:lipoprotein-anchoring transpeptidase ErfK/SrfK